MTHPPQPQPNHLGSPGKRWGFRLPAGGRVNIPVKCRELIITLMDGGWSFVVNHGKDTGDSPFINIEARRDTQHVYVTWHTRATGTYRLFTCMVNKRDVTLTKALEVVAA